MNQGGSRRTSPPRTTTNDWGRRCENGWLAWEKPADRSTWNCCKGWAPGWTPRPKRLEGKTIRQFLVEKLLQVRTKQGEIKPLVLNRAQQEYEGRCSKKNIVLKARQLGITTYVAARFFVHTITRRGTLSVQVAHDQDSAEEIFRIVHRLLENLPEPLQAGALETSRANVRQIVFPQLDSEYRVETAADPNAGRG